MEAGQVQGVSAPLITVQTPTEKIRIIRVSKSTYNTLRSFTESSLKEDYPWRVGYEWGGEFEWVKEGKWRLLVYKHAKVLNVEKLPTKGIYKVIDKIVQPTAILTSLAGKGELWFVVVETNEWAVYHSGDAVKLAFTSRAPVVFEPMMPVPFARPIPVREIIDVLNHYVSF